VTIRLRCQPLPLIVNGLTVNGELCFEPADR
jgi:hypothetical protein